MCDCMRVCVWGGGVLQLCGVVMEAPWRFASQPSGQMIHTGANVTALTTNKILVVMELDLYHEAKCDRMSLRTELN